MSCLDSATLWAMEAGELQGDDLAAARHHARSCLVCETERRDLAHTRRLLSLAGAAPVPKVAWSSVDAAVDDAITSAAARSFAGWSWKGLLLPALATAAAALFFVARPAPAVKQLAPVAVATVVTQKQPVVAETNEVVALVKEKKVLPAPLTKPFATSNGSRIQLSKGGTARKVGGNGVQLHGGEAFIRGKSGLIVTALGAKLKAQSDALFIASLQPELDVVVAEGAVLVERDDGATVVVHAGERYSRGTVSRADSSARFAAFGVTVKRAIEPEPERSAETLFIQRAQLSLKAGHCGEFLLGLQTLAFDAEAPAIRARARITKARCHDERLEPDQAAIEYSRYVRDFPTGEAATEARAALRH